MEKGKKKNKRKRREIENQKRYESVRSKEKSSQEIEISRKK